MHDPEVTSLDLSENVIEFLQTMLLKHPYPTNNIIEHIIDTRDHEKNHVLEEIIFSTTIKLIEMIEQFPDEVDKKSKLYNLLSNIFISDNKNQTLQNIIIPALYNLKENLCILDHG